MFSIAIMFVLLVLVHFIGFSAGGAQSWIQVPGFGSIQPSEFAKLVIIVYFASVFAKKYEAGTLDSINKSILPPVSFLVLAIGSIMLETDIGTSFIIIMAAIAVIAASGIKVKTFTKLSGILLLFMIPIVTILYFAMGLRFDRQ